MGLIDYPMANRGQNPALGSDIAEQQRVIGDHHVGMCRAATSTVNQAFVGEERAQATGTLARGRRKVGTVDAAPANAKRIEVAVCRLTHVRHNDRNRGERVSRITLGGDLDLTSTHAFELTQTRIVVIALQRAKRQTVGQLLGKFWQLMVHKLIGKVIRFGRDANGNVVTARSLGKRHEIGHRLTDARTRLDYTVRARDECIAHLERHRDLLITRLVRGIHAIDQAARGIIRLDLFATRHLEHRQFIGIHAILSAVGLENVGASGAEREDGAGVLSRQEREDGTIGPRHIGVHVGQARHKTLRQVGKRHEQHAPHPTQGVDVGIRTMRHRVAAEQIGHKGQLVRGQARKRNARQRQ